MQSTAPITLTAVSIYELILIRKLLFKDCGKSQIFNSLVLFQHLPCLFTSSAESLPTLTGALPLADRGSGEAWRELQTQATCTEQSRHESTTLNSFRQLDANEGAADAKWCVKNQNELSAEAAFAKFVGAYKERSWADVN